MRIRSLIFSAATLFLLSQCGESEEPKKGDQQISPPVENSGASTEAERATEAVDQDTTNSQITPGKDDGKKDSAD